MQPENYSAKILQNLCQLDKYVVILAHGEFPSSNYLRSLIKDAKYLLCCDGAVNNLVHTALKPDYIIGDCDSISEDLRQYYQDQIIQIADQNTNDLTKAVNFAYDKLAADNILILGATGLREDHTLANISLLLEYSKIINNIMLVSDYGIFSICNKSVTLAAVPMQQVSLLACNPNTTVSSTGLKWELDNLLIDSWYKGTLNEAISDSITIKSSHPIIIYRAFEIK